MCIRDRNVGVIGPVKRGFNTSIECAWGESLAEASDALRPRRDEAVEDAPDVTLAGLRFEGEGYERCV